MCLSCEVPFRYPARLSAPASQVTEACYKHILPCSGWRGGAGGVPAWAGVHHPGVVVWMISEFSFSVIRCGSDMNWLLQTCSSFFPPPLLRPSHLHQTPLLGIDHVLFMEASETWELSTAELKPTCTLRAAPILFFC